MTRRHSAWHFLVAALFMAALGGCQLLEVGMGGEVDGLLGHLAAHDPVTASVIAGSRWLGAGPGLLISLGYLPVDAAELGILHVTGWHYGMEPVADAGLQAISPLPAKLGAPAGLWLERALALLGGALVWAVLLPFGSW